MLLLRRSKKWKNFQGCWSGEGLGGGEKFEEFLYWREKSKEARQNLRGAVLTCELASLSASALTNSDFLLQSLIWLTGDRLHGKHIIALSLYISSRRERSVIMNRLFPKWELKISCSVRVGNQWCRFWRYLCIVHVRPALSAQSDW